MPNFRRLSTERVSSVSAEVKLSNYFCSTNRICSKRRFSMKCPNYFESSINLEESVSDELEFPKIFLKIIFILQIYRNHPLDEN